MSNQSLAPEPSAAHVKLIDDLGGPRVVARELSARLHLEEFTGNAVSNWKRRGIPWRFRGPLVVLAQELDVAVPDNFFGTSPTTDE